MLGNHPNPLGGNGPSSGGEGGPAASDLTGTTLAANVVNSSLTSVGTGYTLVKTATVTLTDAQIKALPTTPVTIVPAPGAGKIALLLGGLGMLTIDTAYSNVSASAFVVLSYDPDPQNYFFAGSGTPAGATTQGWFQGLSRVAWRFEPSQILNGGDLAGYVAGDYATDTAPDYPLANLPILLTFSNGAGDLTGGDVANTLKITVWYLEVDL